MATELGNGQNISIHALREEGDQAIMQGVYNHIISIHALREEGDGSTLSKWPVSSSFQSTPSARRATPALSCFWLSTSLFQSTPSARRATLLQGFQHPHIPISIHALREEGDHESCRVRRP